MRAGDQQPVVELRMTVDGAQDRVLQAVFGAVAGEDGDGPFGH